VGSRTKILYAIGDAAAMLDAQLDKKVCSEEAEATIEKKDWSSRKADRTKK
jgi:hypothetical protein